MQSRKVLVCVSLLLLGTACQTLNNKFEISDADLNQLTTDVTRTFAALQPQVIQPAEGYLKYPYLIPAGFYKQMWDWDGFFMGNHLVSVGKPEYLKYWALNLIEGIDADGYVSGCATTRGPRPIFGRFAMKPFLSQGVWLASVALDDFSWAEPHFDEMMKVLAYREKTQQDSATGLFFWEIAMQSGADNNPALNYFQDDTRSFLAADASAWQYREYVAQALLAEKLGRVQEAQELRDKAARLKDAMNRVLWNDADEIFYNVDRETGEHYRRVSYAAFVPLLAQIAPLEKGRAMIKRYLTAPEHMKAAYGFRSLSRSDVDYNNKNVIVPFSNWQGPVWPIANYIYSVGLRHYGFNDELRWQAATLGRLLLADAAEWGSMHENYHADTGAPLAPAADHVDANGRFVGFISWNLCVQNMLEGVSKGRWMLLELQ